VDLYTTSLSGTNAGGYSQGWSFGSNPNYNPIAGTLAFEIAKASTTTTTVGAGPFTYDGTTHTGGSGAVSGAGVVTGGVTLTYSGDRVNAGTYYVTAHYAGDENHEASDGQAVAVTINKATATVSYSGYSGGVYDGTAHTRTVTVGGVGGVDLYTTSLSGTNAGSYNQGWTFDDPNYETVGGTLAFSISARSLSPDDVTGVTQGAINVSSNGTVGFALSVGQNGIVDGQTVSQLFNNATFTLKMRKNDGTWEGVECTATATVVDGVIYVNLSLKNQDQLAFLMQGVEAAKSAATADLDLIRLSATSNDSNYTLTEDVLARIFKSGK
jgi:hypothetical protein